MTNYKSHHFVPRSYFRPFSKDGAGKAVNLLHIGSLKLIQNASIRGQCSKDNFYGKDKRLEKLLQVPESRYSKLVKKIEADDVLAEEDLFFIRDFSYLQYVRTDTAIRRTKVSMEGMRELIFEGSEDDPRNSPWGEVEYVQQAIDIFVDSVRHIGDLKVCILCNHTSIEFVTSDDPAVLTNRFYAQRVGNGLDGAGISNAGIMIFMPLSPQHMVVSYDGGVYTIPDKSRSRVKIYNDNDILALNQLQFLKAGQNIYFQSWSDRKHIHEKFVAVAINRPEEWYELNYAVLDEETADGKRYRVVKTKKERQSAKGALIHLKSVPLVPKDWFSKVKFRHKPLFINTKSGAGYKRRPPNYTSG